MSAPATPPVKPRRRWTRWLKRILLSLLVIALILVFGVIPYLFSVLMTSAGTRPMDRRLTSSPADFGIPFQDVEFKTSDNLTISGWYIASRGKSTTIIYSHGLFRSRRELLDRARDLCRLGYGALLYDSRNHGDSGKARTTLGYQERLDAEAAVSYLRDSVHSPDHIVLLGVSMGAVADILAAAETPDVVALVSDSSYLSFDDTVAHHLKLFFHMPRFPLVPELEFLISRRAGYQDGGPDPLAVVGRLDRPILFIGGAHDARMPPDVARRLYDASPNPKKELLIVDGPGSEVHGHSYLADPKLYVDKVSAFIDSAVGTSASAR